MLLFSDPFEWRRTRRRMRPGLPRMSESSDYPGRAGYRNPAKAERYAGRSPSRNASEERLLVPLLQSIRPKDEADRLVALDIPAGAGRMSRCLKVLGFEVFESDIAFEMLAMGRRLSDGKTPPLAVVGDLEGRLPFHERAFDLVLCWRLLHHLPSHALLGHVLLELSRVSRRWVIVSFFHPVSLHNLQRQVVRAVTGRRSIRYAHHPATIRRMAEEAGLRVWKWGAQTPYLRDLWVAVCLKDPQ